MFLILNLVSSGLEAIILVLGTILIIVFLIGLVMYLLQSIGLYKIGQRAGIQNSWLAFIPPFNLYIMGKVLGPDRVRFLGQNITNPEVLMPLTPFIMGAIAPFTSTASGGVGALLYLIFLVVNILGAIFLLVCNYQFLKMFKGDSAKLLFVVSIIFPIVWPFIIFSMRNSDPVDGGYYDGYTNYDNNYYENY